VRRTLAAACGLAAMAAACWVVRIAWADRLSRANDEASVARAVRLAPGNADLRLRLASITEAAGGDATAALTAAAAIDPDNATVFVRLGLAAEMRGDFDGAERALLQAAHVSRKFEPRWTLANYYCRRADSGRFWPWAKEALLKSYGDPTPIFQLCWKMSQDPNLILERAIPERRTILNPYLAFLLKANHPDAAEPVIAKLGSLATMDDRPVLLAWCDRQLEAGSVEAPLSLWNTLCARRLLPYPALEPGTGASLTDGAFREDAGTGGFGWRFASLPGVRPGHNVSPPYVWFAFDGGQPESCEPLTQYLPLAPGARYRLRFEYRTAEVPVESGLRLSVFDFRTGKDLGGASPRLSSADWTAGESYFTALNTRLARLALSYRRLPGTTRIEGTLFLRRLSLEKLP